MTSKLDTRIQDTKKVKKAPSNKVRKPKILKFSQLDYEVESRLDDEDKKLYNLAKLECKNTTALVKQIYDYDLDMNLVEPNWCKTQDVINSQNRDEYQIQLLRSSVDKETGKKQPILFPRPIGEIKEQVFHKYGYQTRIYGKNTNLVTKPFYEYANEYVRKHISDTTGVVSKLETRKSKTNYLIIKYAYMSFPFELLTRYIESESFTLERYIYDGIDGFGLGSFKCKYRYRGFRDNLYKYYLEHDFPDIKLGESLWETIHNMIIKVKSEKSLNSLRRKAQLLSEEHWDSERVMELHVVARCYMLRANDPQNIIPRLCELLESTNDDNETENRKISIINTFMIPEESEVYPTLLKIITSDLSNNARELRSKYIFLNLTDVTDEQLLCLSKMDAAKINYAIKTDALEYQAKTGEDFIDHVTSTAPLSWFKYLWS